MKKIFLSTLVVLGTTALLHCGKEEKKATPADGPTPGPGPVAVFLENSWKSATCVEKSPIGASERVFLQLKKGGGLVQATEFYSKDGCMEPVVLIIYRGKFTSGEKAREEVEGKNFDLKFEKAAILPLNAEGTKLLSSKKLCGSDKWEINKEQDVTAAKRGADCPLKQLPRDEYSIYALDEGKLKVAKLSRADSESDPKKRPTKLGADSTFDKVDRAFN